MIPNTVPLLIAALSFAPVPRMPAVIAPAGIVVRQDEPAPAEPQKPLLVVGQDVVKEHKLVRLSLNNAPVGYTILWDVHPFGVADKATNTKLKSIVEFTAPPGVYQVQVRAIKGEDVLEAFKTITIQPVVPVPPGPSPAPGPGPTPTPPNPPVPPIAGDGNRVLIVYETGDPLPAPQAAILTSGIVRDYLNAKCVKDSANPNGAYRIWDKDVDTTNTTQSWKDAMKKAAGKQLPWIIISNGKTGFEGPLPADVPQTVELLKKWLGE